MTQNNAGVLLAMMFLSSVGQAFCGCFMGRQTPQQPPKLVADARLVNQASQVVLVRQDNKTAITMFNDFKGDLKEFALLVPVPEVLTREQINVGDKELVDRLNAYSAPRLLESFDSDPCQGGWGKGARASGAPGSVGDANHGGMTADRTQALGISIEAQYTVGEYDIVILGAKESDGLETWLGENNYKMPKGASKALEPYIKQKMKFFVAKVNLKEQAKSGFTYLRPLQFAFESPKFMLPIRLGMANADGPQDLVVYALTPKGRVETTNYRTVKVPTGMEIPVGVREHFPDFYKAVFDTVYKRENQKVVFQEYAWNTNDCAPCVAAALTQSELRRLGVFWIGNAPVFLTRLHVRYDAAHFPEDLFFQETSDSNNFQASYSLRHPFTGSASCALDVYHRQTRDRQVREAQTLARLTGWEVGEIRYSGGKDAQWYQNIFK